MLYISATRGRGETATRDNDPILRGRRNNTLLTFQASPSPLSFMLDEAQILHSLHKTQFLCYEEIGGI